MRYVDEYRAPEQVMQLVAHLQQRARLLPHTAARPLRIMEVCGGHTHAIFKFGLDQLLPENIEFIHGPGCPVCVLPMGRIDACIEIASRPGVIFCTNSLPPHDVTHQDLPAASSRLQYFRPDLSSYHDSSYFSPFRRRCLFSILQALQAHRLQKTVHYPRRNFLPVPRLR